MGARSGGGGASGAIYGRKTAAQLAAQVERLFNASSYKTVGLSQGNRYKKMLNKAITNIQKQALIPKGKALMMDSYTGKVSVTKIPSYMKDMIK